MKQIEEQIVKQKQQHECRSQSLEQLPRGSQKHSKKTGGKKERLQMTNKRKSEGKKGYILSHQKTPIVSQCSIKNNLEKTPNVPITGGK
jgi:hypothetical protein